MYYLLHTDNENPDALFGLFYPLNQSPEISLKVYLELLRGSLDLNFKENLGNYILLILPNAPCVSTFDDNMLKLEIVAIWISNMKAEKMRERISDDMIRVVCDSLEKSEVRDGELIQSFRIKSQWASIAHALIEKTLEVYNKITGADAVTKMVQVSDGCGFKEKRQKHIEFSSSFTHLILKSFESSARSLMDIIKLAGEDFFRLEVACL